MAEKCCKSFPNRAKIDPKGHQNEAKRKMESKQCLPDGLGGLQEAESTAIVRQLRANLEPNIVKRIKQSI